MRGRLQPDIKHLPKELLNMMEIYEINFIPLQFLFTLISEDNIKPNSFTILIWGCGLCVVDYYLDKLGFNIISHDNWSQLPQKITNKFLSRIDNNIKLVNNIEELYKIDYNIIIDTGNWLHPEILRKSSVKFIFTWCVSRLDDKNIDNKTPNLDYLMEHFYRFDVPLCIVFIRK
jgi:hypothetical protein